MLLTIVSNKIIYNDLIIVDEIKAVDKSYVWVVILNLTQIPDSKIEEIHNNLEHHTSKLVYFHLPQFHYFPWGTG